MPNAWDHIVDRLLNERERKPRIDGITMVIDKGMGLRLTEDILEYAGSYIDHWKLSFGTSVFVPESLLQRKLKLLAEHDVVTYPGGTLLEVALVEHHCRVFNRHAKKLGFSAVEISDGTIPLPAFRRANIINCALDAGLIPITEVGKKDPNHQPAPKEIAEQALSDLEAGARWVIVEGRESGKNVGVFDRDGRVHLSDLEKIRDAMGERVKNLVWEAPLKEQQAVFINEFGSNVGLGNVPVFDALAVEALRTGLRYETFSGIAQRLRANGTWDPNKIESRIDQ